MQQPAKQCPKQRKTPLRGGEVVSPSRASLSPLAPLRPLFAYGYARPGASLIIPTRSSTTVRRRHRLYGQEGGNELSVGSAILVSEISVWRSIYAGSPHKHRTPMPPSRGICPIENQDRAKTGPKHGRSAHRCLQDQQLGEPCLRFAYPMAWGFGPKKTRHPRPHPRKPNPALIFDLVSDFSGSAPQKLGCRR